MVVYSSSGTFLRFHFFSNAFVILRFSREIARNSLADRYPASFLLDIVSHDGFVPPEGAEEMIGVVRKAQHGWFPAANRFALAPTELQLLKADIATICETFDNVFVRIEGVVRVGGTFFDQLLEMSDAVLLMVGAGKTPRSAFAFARRHLKSSGKLVMAIATDSSPKRVRKDMEVLS